MSDQIVKHGKGAKVEFDRDSWQTPQWLFDWLDDRLSFTLDIAASDANHKCPMYFTKETNGLAQPVTGHTVF